MADRTTDTQHTQEPWRWSDEYPTRSGDETLSLLGNDGYGVLSCDGRENSPVADDARLIAAAPELLAACEAYATWTRHVEDGPPRALDPTTQTAQQAYHNWYRRNLLLRERAEELTSTALSAATGESAAEPTA